jgi:hypothetical protein
MVQVPRLVKFDLTFEKLKDKYTQSIEPAITRQMESYTKRYEGFDARFSII